LTQDAADVRQSVSNVGGIPTGTQ